MNKSIYERSFLFILILFLIIGAALAYVSQFNSMLVTVNFGFYTLTDIPIFYVIVASLLTGLLLASAIHLISNISHSFVLRGKSKEMKKNKDEILELTKRIHQLELENEKLKHAPAEESPDRFAL